MKALPQILILLCLFSGFFSCHLELLDPIKDGLVAGFTFTRSRIDSKVPIVITFENTSTEAVSYEWDFGDGNTSTQFNPVHTYRKAGDYTIILTATNANGDSDSFSIPISLETTTYELEGPQDFHNYPINVNEQSQDTFLITGFHDEFSPGPFTAVVSGDSMLNYNAFPRQFEANVFYGIIPSVNGSNRGFDVPVYYEGHTLSVQSWISSDILGIANYPGFGVPRSILLGEDTHAYIVGSTSSQKDNINFLKVAERSSPDQQATPYPFGDAILEDATGRDDEGFAMLVVQPGVPNAGDSLLQIQFLNESLEVDDFSGIKTLTDAKGDWKIAQFSQEGYHIQGVVGDSTYLFNLDGSGAISSSLVYLGSESIHQVKSLSDGNLLVYGLRTFTNGRPQGVYLKKMTRDGAVLWDRDFNLSVCLLAPRIVMETQDCGIFLLNQVLLNSFTFDRFHVLKLNAEGLLE